jgi:hypothetical protein
MTKQNARNDRCNAMTLKVRRPFGSGKLAAVTTTMNGATSRIVVVADFIFTATAVMAQPVRGVLLARAVGYSLSKPCIVWSIILYLITGGFWLPVVWMQMRMRDLAAQAEEKVAAPPKPITDCSGSGSLSASRPLPRSQPSSGS